jgi:hypothetical protein
MLSPGSKGWISKYFDLVKKGELWVSIRDFTGMPDLRHLHLTFSRSGIMFGLATRAIFGHKLDASNWTRQEKLKVLLFEALLFVHLKNGGELEKEAFVKSTLFFYGEHNGSSTKKVFTFFLKESDEEKLEKILSKRVDIKMKLLENKWWVNSLTNTFVYLDVILFQDFVVNPSEDAIKNYSDFAQNALTAITLASYADGKVDDVQKDIFEMFLASANLSDSHRLIAENKFKEGATLDDFSDFVHDNWLFKRFLLDISVMTVFSDFDAVAEEKSYIDELRQLMHIPEEEVEETMMFIENFIIENREATDFLKDVPSYEKVYDNFTARWKKILMRNKEKLSVELQESKELVALMKKSRKEELTAEEKEKVKTQLKDILKSMPAFAIFMIPGGAILLPMMVKIIPDLLPTAFKDNEIEE